MAKDPYGFEERIDRSGTDSVKWDGLEKIFGKADALPLWVADMDFQAPPPVLKALKERVEHGVFGYGLRTEACDEAIAAWMQKRHGLSSDTEHLLYVPGVMTGVAKAIQSFSEPGDRVVIQPPVYFPFFDIIRNNERTIGEAPLSKGEEGFEMDFDALEEELSRSDARILLFCSPHNPVGRVWKEEELRKVAELCERYEVLILSDEIHQDIVYSGHRHLPFLSLGPEVQKRCIAFSSPSKTFNLQGLISAFASVPDPRLRKGMQRALKADHVVLENVLSTLASRTAYEAGEEWLDALLERLETNRDRVADYFEGYEDLLTVYRPEGTYLSLLDFSPTGYSDKELMSVMLEEAGVALNGGANFGTGGEGMLRLNFASPPSMLEDGLERIRGALERMKG